MRRDLVTSAVALVALTALLGIGYPWLVTGIGQALFPRAANGSQVKVAGRLVGSRLLAQDFRRSPRHFQERPSTATSYDAAASSFTNLGPNSRKARDTFLRSLRGYLRLERRYDPGLSASEVPVDAVTSSASGVDPHISRANAEIQAHRVAAVRGLALATVRRLIDEHTDGRFLGFFGEPGVNVLELNLALDRLKR